MRKLLTAVILMCGCLIYADTQVSWKDLQNNIDSWLQGPVQLLLTTEEKNVWEKLKSPEEKMQFIKIFWARRDPILRTRENEFKEQFYNRVDYANQNFEEQGTPGWKTARGQVYVMFGPPSRIDHHPVEDSSRPALLWVYDKLNSKRIPANEALMFIWHDFKYILNPPNPDPGDTVGEQQASLDSNFRYQSIPSMVAQAFADVSNANVIDEKKNYDPLIYSVKSTEKFGVASIDFEPRVLQANPPQVEVNIPIASVPVYDSGNQVFAEFLFTQELKQGDKVITRNEHSESFTWTAESFGKLNQISVKLPALQAPSGQYDLYVTVQDRISGVSETKKIQ
jgi:GWxTD domain-containing protein